MENYSPSSSVVGFVQNAVPHSSHSAASETGNTAPGGSRFQAFERRLAWLEEDVAVLHRRLRDDCEGGAGGGTGSASGGDSGLRALVARLDSELAAERQAREMLEMRLEAVEDAIGRERIEREAQLRGFSSELELTMRGLVARIDEGLTLGAISVRERTDETESRLRMLIQRVDEGLVVGAAALQDTLNNASGGSTTRGLPSPSGAEGSPASYSPPGGASRAPHDAQPDGDDPDALIKSFSRLRQENKLLRERQAQAQGGWQMWSPQGGPAPERRGCGGGAHVLSPPQSFVPKVMQVPAVGPASMAASVVMPSTGRPVAAPPFVHLPVAGKASSGYLWPPQAAPHVVVPFGAAAPRPGVGPP